jgi:hypothetical protein
MRRIRVVLCVVLVIAMMVMSAGLAAAGSKPTSVIEPSAQSICNGRGVDELTGGGGTGGTPG